MYVIGITGGVGTGKSTVLKYLSDKYNAYVLEADAVAKELMLPGGATYTPLINLLGRDVLTPDGFIDKSIMAGRIYSSFNTLSKVNAIVHPLVKKCIADRINDTTAPFCVIEAALLSEGKLDELCDTIWYIHTDFDIRIKRLQSSRGYSTKKCMEIINAQKSDADFKKGADNVIDNSGDEATTQAQIRALISHCNLSPSNMAKKTGGNV